MLLGKRVRGRKTPGGEELKNVLPMTLIELCRQLVIFHLTSDHIDTDSENNCSSKSVETMIFSNNRNNRKCEIL